MLHRFPADVRVLGRLTYSIKAAPSKDHTNRYSNSASLVAGGPLITSTHREMKWQYATLGFLSY